MQRSIGREVRLQDDMSSTTSDAHREGMTVSKKGTTSSGVGVCGRIRWVTPMNEIEKSVSIHVQGNF